MSRLRSQLVHTHDDSKYMNVHIVQRMLNDKYSTSPGTAITPIEANKILAETFPSVLHKRMTRGGVKSTFLVGVSMATSMHSTSSSSTGGGGGNRPSAWWVLNS